MVLVLGKLQQSVVAKTILSPRELEVTGLVRLGMGRNAVSQSLGLSPNSVKTIYKRIEKKLGLNWHQSEDIVWPQQTTDEIDTEQIPLNNFDNNWQNNFSKNQLNHWLHRHLSLLLLIKQSGTGRDVLHVSSSQRFWLRPVLVELEARKYIKLLVVDWNETFSPTWLPVVCRGRKEIRAADYATNHNKYVISNIQNYLEYQLQDYVQEMHSSLELVRNAIKFKKEGSVPDFSQLFSFARRQFSL